MVRMIIAGMARVRRVRLWGKRREHYESICSKEEQLAAYGVTSVPSRPARLERFPLRVE